MITYEQDVIAWSTEQAYLLRTGQFDRLDIAHLAKEIEDVGKSEQRELANRMSVLLAHFLRDKLLNYCPLKIYAGIKRIRVSRAVFG